MATHSSIVAWRIPGTGSLVGCHLWARNESDTTERLHFLSFFLCLCLRWPWRRRWHPTPALLPGKSHGRRSLVGYSPWGHKESDTTQQLHFHFHFQPSPGPYGHYSRVNGNSKRTYTKGRLPGAAASAPHLRGKPLLTHASTGDPPTLAGRSGSSVRSLLLSSGSWCMQDFICAVQE